MRRILTICFILLSFSVSAKIENNKEKWTSLKADIGKYFKDNARNIEALKPEWNVENADGNNATQLLNKLDSLYRQAKDISFHPTLNPISYHPHQKITAAIRGLKIELELWKEYNDIVQIRLEPESIPRSKIDLTRDKNNRGRRNGNEPSPRTLLQDLQKINRTTRQDIEKYIDNKNLDVKKSLDNLQEDVSYLGKGEIILEKTLSFNLRIERYMTLLQAYKRLKEVLEEVS